MKPGHGSIVKLGSRSGGSRAMLALLALAFGSATARAGTTAARAKTVIMAPLTLTSTSPLAFGDLAAGATAGTIVVSPQGARTRTGGATLLGGTVGSAGFIGTSTRNANMIVRVVTTAVILTRSGGGATMRVINFTLGSSQVQPNSGGLAYEFRLGGTLQVGAAQPDGAYEGSFDVTVDYQ